MTDNRGLDRDKDSIACEKRSRDATPRANRDPRCDTTGDRALAAPSNDPPGPGSCAGAVNAQLTRPRTRPRGDLRARCASERSACVHAPQVGLDCLRAKEELHPGLFVRRPPRHDQRDLEFLRRELSRRVPPARIGAGKHRRRPRHKRRARSACAGGEYSRAANQQHADPRYKTVIARALLREDRYTRRRTRRGARVPIPRFCQAAARSSPRPGEAVQPSWPPALSSLAGLSAEPRLLR